MQKSESIAKLAGALVKFQAEMNKVVKDTKAFNYKYADMAAVWDSIRNPLTDAGLCVTQVGKISEPYYHSPKDGETEIVVGIVVETVLVHTSGEWMSGETYYPLAKRDPQAVGSAMTYGRRYGLMAILGVVTDDDDGQAGSQTRGLANNAPANDKWNTKPPANPPAQAKPALASKPEPAKPQEPAKDYLGTGTEAKKKEKKFKDLCTALNKAGDSNDGNKWNSEVLNDFTLAFHGKGLADCDKAEILAIIDALEERLEEREAMSAQDESEPKPVQEKTTGTEPMITDAQTNGITRMCDIKDKHMPDIVSEFTGQRTEVLAEMTEAEAATALKAMMKM